jgi:hypothetical protein
MVSVLETSIRGSKAKELVITLTVRRDSSGNSRSVPTPFAATSQPPLWREDGAR